MIHFTSTAWMVVANIPGRDGSYGATTSIVGIFNTKKRAESGKSEFIKGYKGKKVILINSVSIKEITPGKVDEVVIARNYE